MEKIIENQGYTNVKNSQNIMGFYEAEKKGQKYYIEYYHSSSRDEGRRKIRVENLKKVRSENVLSFVDFFKNNEYNFFVYVYEEGILLSDQFRNIQYDEKSLSKITYQILKGLQSLHAYNIVHTNLSVDSIIQCRDTYKLVKLSNAAEQGKSNVSMIIQDWFYPYEFIDEPDTPMTSKYDVWSLGLVIFKLITKKDAFQSVRNLMEYGETNKLEHIKTSDALNNFLQNCLYTDPDSRPDVNELLENPFIKMFVEIYIPTTAPPSTSTSTPTPPSTSPHTKNQQNISNNTQSPKRIKLLDFPNYFNGLMVELNTKSEKIKNDIIHLREQKDKLEAVNRKKIDDLESQISERLALVSPYSSDFSSPPVSAGDVSDQDIINFNQIVRNNPYVNGTVNNQIKKFSLRSPKDKYDWQLFANCFVQFQSLGIEIYFPNDYSFDLDEIDQLSAVMKILKPSSVSLPMKLEDALVDKILQQFTDLTTTIQFKRDRISIYKEFEVASYKSTHKNSQLEISVSN